MKRARGIYQDENKNSSFNHEKAWAILPKHAKWDAPDPTPVDLTEDENVPDERIFAVNTDELFGLDARPRPPGQHQGTSPSGTKKRSFIFGSNLSESIAEGTPIRLEAGEQDFTSRNWRHPWDQSSNYQSFRMTALIKQHNERFGTLIEPIRLSFGDEDEGDKGKGADKGAGDAEDEDLQNLYKEVMQSLFTR
ncbi:hypothetical protein Tco_0014027 [Tanacetum coccineum]